MAIDNTIRFNTLSCKWGSMIPSAVTLLLSISLSRTERMSRMSLGRYGRPA